MKLHAAPLLGLCLGLCLVSGAARAGMFDDEEARRDIAALRGQVGASQKAVEDRLVRIETMLQDRSIEVSKLIDELKQDLARVRGQIEVQANQIDTLDRRQKDLYIDLDTRLRKIEANAQAQAQAQEKQAAEPVAEAKAYEAALNQFKLGNFQSSVAAFQNFLTTYPNSAQLPSAQYWIGNAYYALRDFKMAIAAQQKVLSTWPDSAKAPDAMLNIASCQAETGETKAARDTLQQVLKKYPGTPAAEQAKQRLAGKR
ncbi:MAG: tol-pal system protein YbgF [Proteobacteria bacterium]|nr:tol-pal system protein YbgF [Pseudomonadota bacterium]